MESFKSFGMDMARFTMATALALVGLGVLFFFLTGMEQKTALIPSVVGALLFLMGFLTMKMPEKRKIFMHIAVLLGLVCATAVLRDVPDIMESGFSPNGELSLALVEKMVMMVVGVVYTVQCVRSFIAARRS